MKRNITPEKASSETKKVNISEKFSEYISRPIRIKYFLISSVILVAAVLLSYSNLHRNQLLNWDDDLYVYENSDITGLQAENFKAFFTKRYVYNYLPLTMISYAVDYKIGKLNPKVYTGTNLFIHAINAILVFWLIVILLKKAADSGFKLFEKISTQYLIAFITALLFAIHPLQVETVAWVAERKNILYTLFFLLSLISYIKYIERKKFVLLILSIVLFAASLLSKGVAVSLALCVVIADYFYSRKLLSTRVLLEKIPFFLLAIVFGVVAIMSQYNKNELAGSTDFPFYEQLAFASYGFVNYIVKLLVPVNISAYYSYPKSATLLHYSCLFLVMALAIALIYYRKKMPSIVVFGILFYFSNLFFLLQMIPVGDAIMADRYIYVSSIGFFLILAIGLQKLTRKYKIAYGLAFIVIFFYAYTAHQQVKTWKNSIVFWDNVISMDDQNPMAFNNRGIAKKDLGDNEGALEDFNKTIAILPESRKAYNNKGSVLHRLGRINEALSSYTKAIDIDPNYADAFCNRALLRDKTNDLSGALDDLNRTLSINPQYLRAYIGRAIVKNKLKDYTGAIADCDKALELNSSMADAYSIKGLALYYQTDYQSAIVQFSQAIKLFPGNVKNYHNRGAAYYYSGNYKAAIEDMNVVLQYKPNEGISYYIRGLSYALLGNNQQACKDLNKSINKGFTTAQADFDKYCK